MRQLSNRRQVVNLVYNGVPSYLLEEEGPPTGPGDPSPLGVDADGLELRECKVKKERREVDNFEKEFDAKFLGLRHTFKNGKKESFFFMLRVHKLFSSKKLKTLYKN